MHNNRKTVYIIVAIACVVFAIGGAFAFWPTPQMGGDEAVISAVDALFTAVTARDEELLSQCERRLEELKTQAKLPPAAAGRLAGIIEQARGGSWEPAAKRLYSFIESQRI